VFSLIFDLRVTSSPHGGDVVYCLEHLNRIVALFGVSVLHPELISSVRESKKFLAEIPLLSGVP
jgi:hypothetical protein